MYRVQNFLLCTQRGCGRVDCRPGEFKICVFKFQTVVQMVSMHWFSSSRMYHMLSENYTIPSALHLACAVGRRLSVTWAVGGSVVRRPTDFKNIRFEFPTVVEMVSIHWFPTSETLCGLPHDFILLDRLPSACASSHRPSETEAGHAVPSKKGELRGPGPAL